MSYYNPSLLDDRSNELRVRQVLQDYDIKLNGMEFSVMKYMCFPDKDESKFKVSMKDQERFQEMVDNERSESNGFNMADKIIIFFGSNKYEFANDDIVKSRVNWKLHDLIAEYLNGDFTFSPTIKEHKRKRQATLILNFIERYTESLSKNKRLHLTYDLLNAVFPKEFKTIKSDDPVTDRKTKASRITRIIG